MVLFISSFLIFLTNSLRLLFRFIALHVLSIIRLTNEDSSASESTESKHDFKKAEEKDETEEKIEKNIPNFIFKLQYQIAVDECRKTAPEQEVVDKETLVAVMGENETPMTSADIHKYHFLSKKDACGHMKEPKAMNFHVHESVVGLEEYNFHGDRDIKLTMKPIAEEERKSDADKVLSSLNKQEVPKDMKQLRYQLSGEENFNSSCSETSSLGEREVMFISKDFSGFDSGTESSDGYSVRELITDSDCSGLLSEGYFGDCEHDSYINGTSTNNSNKLTEGRCESFSIERSEVEEGEDDDGHSEEDKIISSTEENMSLESHSNETSSKIEPNSNNEELSFVNNGSTSLHNFGEHPLESAPKTLDREELRQTVEDNSNDGLNNSVYLSYESKHNIDNHDTERKEPKSCTWELNEDELDGLWEHQDLIEQLQMELRRVRAIGLPTILEESESPRAIDDSKTLKFDEKFLHEDPMDELNKLHKCYRQKMRKFDILNYQKMYATGFLQLKDPLELMRTRRPMFSTIMSGISQSLLPFCKKKSNNDPSEKFIKELQCDLEAVYVGQTCLSWEFIWWQYEKLSELPVSNSLPRYQYNHVAGEFLQFNVILQKFVENELFQGPRLPNYVKQRCILRNLLQVPVIKEDCLKEKMEKWKGNDAITREMLGEIVGEAIRIFWEFVKAEKYETPRILKGLVENHVELQDQLDYVFMADIQASLQKKEKKLKELLKAGNCIVKKLRRQQEDRTNQELFFSQVDLKLVSRVLRMSRITGDQLIWCHKKLCKITFSGKKVIREPSFLLFPC